MIVSILYKADDIKLIVTGSHMRIQTPALCLTLSLALTCPARAALPPEARTTQAIDRLHANWTAREKAPSGIAGIAQTPDGWIWISSSSGLYKFDGVSFARAEGAEAPLSYSISCIGVLRDGTMWVGYRYGGISLLRNGKMHHYRLDDPDTPTGTIRSATQDQGGTLWLATGRGLHYFGSDQKWHKPDASLQAPDGDLYSVLADRRGTLWVRSTSGVYALFKGASAFQQRSSYNGSGILAEHPDGSVWTTDSEKPGVFLVAEPDHGAPLKWHTSRAFSGILFDHEGFAWLQSGKGVARLGDASTHQPLQETGIEQGLSGQKTNFLFEDREHNVWVATENGLDRFHAARLQSLRLEDYGYFSGRPIAAGAGGSAWIDHSYLASPDAAPTSLTFPSPQTYIVTALNRAPDGTVWAGGTGGQMWKVEPGGVRSIPPPAGINPTNVYAIAQDRRGILWVSMGRYGIFTLEDKNWAPAGNIPELASFAASTITADQSGRVWFGSVNNQIAVLTSKSVKRYSDKQGLAVGTVMHILPVDGGAWVGGENGLAHFNGQRFDSIKGAGGEPFAGINGMVFDNTGRLWINGGDGISSIDSTELKKALSQPGYLVNFDRLDYRDGLKGSSSSILPTHSAARSDDGTLWFSTTGGVYAFNPAKFTKNTLVPPVIITALRAGATNYARDEDARLPAGTETLDIDFTALSYQEPGRMRFRYKLDGVDHEWREADGQRSAHYTNLGPGHYRFTVLASNNDGVWNMQGAAQSFEIAPKLKQTMWFRILCVIAFVILLISIYLWRTRQLAHRYDELLQERLSERERIARALHDTLLQSMQALILHFHGLAKRLPKDSDDHRDINAILDQADLVMADGRSELMNLRTRADDDGDIVHALSKFGYSLQENFGARFKVTRHGSLLELDPYANQEIFCIGREALFNAFKHASAHTIELEISYGSDNFILCVRDDGVGIDHSIQSAGRKQGHWGLDGMRERASTLDSNFVLANRPGQGTEAILTVPARRAYHSMRGLTLPAWRAWAARWKRSKPGGR
ncbi:hypothetical protein GJ698_00940 [Pseudoduganella sp. FT26W]|uniref:Histidine kinase/HSP90-like ATPase domain-containing protein n=1 Tax=Duganella aquatilis TaxID=2666082 RepID=A0A844CYU7_9BURK|nr:sensor histidine kinase [Duganella aquatilis]MRW82655.1 hypothetical protein [Duganella aquatilis]